jgi:hypothetical protein
MTDGQSISRTVDNRAPNWRCGQLQMVNPPAAVALSTRVALGPVC